LKVQGDSPRGIGKSKIQHAISKCNIVCFLLILLMECKSTIWEVGYFYQKYLENILIFWIDGNILKVYDRKQ